MKIFRLLFPALFFAIISCEKSDDETQIGKKLEFYLLESHQTIDKTMRIDESTACLSNEVLISYDDIISYTSSEYCFKISEEIINELKGEKGLNYHTQAFAVTIDKEIIYTGYFWYAFSSRYCDWTTIDPILSECESGLTVNLAYPTNDFSISGIDKRNDSRILRLLKKDGKLVP